MTRRLLAAALALAGAVSPARSEMPPLDPQQERDYIAILRADRAGCADQFDVARLQVESLRRAVEAHDAAVDAWWRAYTGLDRAEKK